MSRIRVALSSLSNNIFAGRINKAGTMWKGSKQDVTEDCLNAVIGHIQKAEVTYTIDGTRFVLKGVPANSLPHDPVRAAEKIKALEKAIKPFAEEPCSEMDSYPCHQGITTKEKCGRCSRAIAAYKALHLFSKNI